MTQITQEKLKELFIYDPDSGLFVRRKRAAPNAPPAGWLKYPPPDKRGYMSKQTNTGKRWKVKTP